MYHLQNKLLFWNSLRVHMCHNFRPSAHPNNASGSHGMVEQHPNKSYEKNKYPLRNKLAEWKHFRFRKKDRSVKPHAESQQCYYEIKYSGNMMSLFGHLKKINGTEPHAISINMPDACSSTIQVESLHLHTLCNPSRTKWCKNGQFLRQQEWFKF